MVRLLLLLPLLLLPAACRSPDELASQVNAIVLVINVDDDEVVVVDVADARRRAAPKNEVVEVKLVLPAGEHQGAVALFEVDDDDGGAERCGSFTITVGEELATAALDAEDLEDCEDDEDGEEGEGEEGEGEEGEGEEGEGEEEEEEGGEGEEEEAGEGEEEPGP